MLLTTNNTKILKGEKLGYRTFGIHFAPASLSGKNVCPSSSAGCRQSCLYLSGQGYYQRVQDARVKKTKYFFENRANFLSELVENITTMARRAKKNNMVPCFRLNLTSDIAWESIKVEGKSLMDMFPDVQFYDYCKGAKRMLNFLEGKFPKNYHLTFSRSESNQTHCDIVMACGGNVAMVFRNTLPKTYKGKTVINGDESDLRFLDPKGVIVGLVAKGVGKKDASGFIIDLE
jgi:hypothetical protein